MAIDRYGGVPHKFLPYAETLPCSDRPSFVLFETERGIHGSKAKHMDPAVYNAIKAEETKLEAEKDGLKKQKEVLEDEVDTLLS